MPLSRRRFLASGAAAGTLMLLPGACGQPGPTTLELLTFPGSTNLPWQVAQKLGFLSARGLAVRREAPATSMELVRGVNSGRFPIGTSSIDNVVAYTEGQGEIELDEPVDLVAFLNLQRNLVLPLIVTPDIADIADLRGRTLAVDAVGTGFSFVLREILRAGGLGMTDYELVSVGNAAARLDSLVAGEHAGAVLTPPFDARAEAAGLKRLASSADVFESYQGTTFVTSRSWAQAHEEELVGFVSAMLDSYAFIVDPANAVSAAAIFAEHNPGASPQAAAGAVAGLARSLTPDFNIAGIETALALRSRYGEPQKTLDDPSRYYDTRWLEAARAARGRP